MNIQIISSYERFKVIKNLYFTINDIMYLNVLLKKLISQWRDKPEYRFLMTRNDVHDKVYLKIQELYI